jgi:hypothetical protein
MTVTCRMVEYDETRDWQVGDMYEAPWYLDNSFRLSGIAEQHKGKTPIVVVLPNLRHFCLHQRAYSAPKYDDSIPHAEWEALGWYGDGWTITGTAPNLTASPSIDADSSKGRWHGHLENGVLK